MKTKASQQFSIQSYIKIAKVENEYRSDWMIKIYLMHLEINNLPYFPNRHAGCSENCSNTGCLLRCYKIQNECKTIKTNTLHVVTTVFRWVLLCFATIFLASGLLAEKTFKIYMGRGQ